MKLHGDLCRNGATPWIDTLHIVGGQDWEHAIRTALRSCTHVIAIISKQSVSKRGYVQKEIVQALTLLDEFPPGSIYVIPVRLDGTEPIHEGLRKLHWIDLFPDYDGGLRRLCAALGLPEARGISELAGSSSVTSVAAEKQYERADPQWHDASAFFWFLSLTQVPEDAEKLDTFIQSGEFEDTLIHLGAPQFDAARRAFTVAGPKVGDKVQATLTYLETAHLAYAEVWKSDDAYRFAHTRWYNAIEIDRANLALLAIAHYFCGNYPRARQALDAITELSEYDERLGLSLKHTFTSILNPQTWKDALWVQRKVPYVDVPQFVASMNRLMP
jgi:tetratricopeptide (TPR) repeat protein